MECAPCQMFGVGGAVDRCCTPNEVSPRAWYGGVGDCSVVPVTPWHRNLHCPGALTARRRRCDSHSSKSRQPAYQGSTLRGTAHSEGRLASHHRRVSVMEVHTDVHRVLTSAGTIKHKSYTSMSPHSSHGASWALLQTNHARDLWFVYDVC